MRTRSRARSRRGVRSAISVAAQLAFALGCGPARVERVVLVTIDTLRADHVGSYGGSQPTPTLDAIAEEGARFATAIAPTPLTLPSHTSLLTGLDPPRHGVRNNSTFRLPDDVPTLGERMREAGFATAAFVGAVVLDRQFGLARGFDTYDDRMSARLAAGGDGFSERTADRVIDAALAWLDAAPPRFFVWVHLYDPHADYAPPPSFRARFPNALYDGEIAFADRELGRFAGRVRDLGLADRTLVVVVGDHGESLGDHGEEAHGLLLYGSSMRVPLIFCGPTVLP